MVVTVMRYRLALLLLLLTVTGTVTGIITGTGQLDPPPHKGQEDLVVSRSGGSQRHGELRCAARASKREHTLSIFDYGGWRYA